MLFWLHLFGFGTAATLCFLALLRARKVTDRETRIGLVALLTTTGGWSLSYVGYLLTPTDLLTNAIYLVGLTIGFATVGCWLYFASAYTGRTYHRNRRLRGLAVAVYVAIVAVKLTNPFHSQYYTMEAATVPFAHLTVVHEPFHWVTTAFSYMLAGIGLFMLLEMFAESEYDTRPLSGLAVLTGLPVVFDIVGYQSDLLLGMIYSPLGVAIFAIGVLFVHQDRFMAVQLTDKVDEATVFLDDDDRVRDFNRRAATLVPELDGSVGQPVETVLPEVGHEESIEQRILERERNGTTNYYLASTTSFELGATRIGKLLMLTDVTETEKRRRELERQNDQLHDFAEALTHELRNTLTIIEGHVSLAGDAITNNQIGTANDSLQAVSGSASRMTGIVNDLSILAKYGQTARETEHVDIADAARTARTQVDAGDLSVTVDGDLDVDADGARVRALFKSAYEFFDRNGADAVEIQVSNDEIRMSGNGTPPIKADLEEYFEYGSAVPTSEAGVALPNVRALARVHGWTTRIDPEYTDGIRVVVDTDSHSDR
ncbi:sensor histidine kinase [Natranaeroarchaeum aerophilus]|uniref:sensor histidine kinase n=1 Tax=Natranaeroarchaeum aerophilus TaxID=2917711 RepID=UPI0020C7C059|nr:histidine kinase N-terminal 7TM domain-containing protein [Natranaeroarchaeum aerophilus]